MAFWSTSLEPKRQFKFKVTFNAFGTDTQFLAQSAGRPQYTISDTVAVDFLDKKFHFPGKITWEPVTIKFVDAVQSNVSRRTYEYLANAGWVNPDNVVGQNVTGFGTISKARAVASTGNVQVAVLDTNGVQLDLWTLKNAFVTKVVFNELDYAQEGILTAVYTFRYDWADFTSPAAVTS
jgi:hypothetical protein